MHEACICKSTVMKCYYRPRIISRFRYHVASNKAEIDNRYLINGCNNLISKRVNAKM